MPGKAAAATVAQQLRALVETGDDGLVINYSALAARLDVAEDLARDAVAELRKQGQLLVLRAGRSGVRLRIPTPVKPSSRLGAIRPRVAGRACPACGTGAKKDWLYCARCGRPLPA
jgi:hypothetical protein